MENPWANAWADSAKSPLPEPSLTWAAPSVSVVHADHEDDLSTSPWPKGSDSEWGQSDLATDVIWTTTESVSMWNPLPSTFDKMALGRDSNTNSPNPLSADLKDERDDHASSLLDPPEAAPTTVEVELLSISPVLGSQISIPPSGESEGGWTTTRSRIPSPVPTPPDIFLLPREDPDSFGSFETGASSLDREAWTPTKLSFPSAPSSGVSAWDSAWQQPFPTNSDGKEDAWELAKREKDVQDRHVPPELLASILQQLETLSKDLWGEDIPTTEVGNEFDTRITLNDSSLAHRLAPEDLVLSPKPQFQNTFTSKQLTEGLKLTKNFSSTRSSPMAKYTASKGSTSWEASVKARPMVAPDDFTPPGWKIAETAKETESPAEDEKKVTGLFSFFARRAGTSNNTRTSSLGIPTGETSAKNSISRSDTTPPTLANQTSRPGSVVSNRTPSEIPTTPKSDASPSLFAPSLMDGSIEETQPGVASQSLVSRFFGRMSSRPTKHQSRDSLALTPDDLEFLADVPTESSNTDINFGILDIDTLNFIAKPTQLPEVLPLPLPPPPPFRKPTSLPTPQATSSSNHDSPPFLDGPDSKPAFSSRASPSSYAKHTTSLSSSSISHPSSPNSIKSDVVKPPIDDGIPGKTQSQLGTLPPPLVATMPLVASSSSLDTTSSRNTSSTRLSSFKLSTMSMGQSSTGLFPPFNTPPTKLVSVASNQVDDEDEFSDFLSSPSISNPQIPTGDFADFAIDTPTTSSATLMAINDDFGNFANALSSPNPPPPVKTAGMTAPSSNRKSDSLPPICIQPGSHSSKGSQKADHSRTLNLLEIAPARGRWLSPPSPIPQALSPPPGSAIPKSSSNGHLYGRSETKSMQAQQGGILASFGTTSPSPAAIVRTPQQALLPAPLSTSLLVPLPTRPPSLTLQQNGGPPDSTKRIGGLSAQELSFFEGL